MRTITKLMFIAGVLAVTSAQAQTPNWSNEQAAVWTVVEQSWDAQAAENGKWPGDFVRDDLIQWSDNIPAPRGKDAYIAWQRSVDESSNSVWHEISPLAISVAGDTAVVAYSAFLGFENSDGTSGTAVRSIVEVLVSDGRSWKYLATSDFSPSYGN
jgi:ketosteroid isomerase-like protein